MSVLQKLDVSVSTLLVALFLLYFVYWWLMSVNLKPTAFIWHVDSNLSQAQ